MNSTLAGLLAATVMLACAASPRTIIGGTASNESAAGPQFRRCDSLPRETKYRPQPITMLMPPFPVPQSMRGTSVTSAFEVDERGRITELRMTRAKDPDYGQRLARVWRSMKFRPGKTPDGTPVKGCFQLLMNF
jgi:hypothetical protein